MKCIICDTENPGLSWTDTHGIAQCVRCGAPYRVFHYDEDKKRVDKPVESIVSEDWVPRLRQYWGEEKRMIPSGCSFPGGQELASREDHERFNAWCEQHAPPTQEADHGA